MNPRRHAVPSIPWRRIVATVVLVAVAVTAIAIAIVIPFVNAEAAPPIFPKSRGWSRRRIARVALSSSLSRASNDPFVSALVSSSKRRKATTTATATATSISAKGTTGQQPLQSSSSSSQSQILSIPQRLVSGGCSRGIAQAVLYPLDALRTLAQTRDGRTLADVGAKSLVNGCLTTSAFAFFIGGIQFAIFGATKTKCGPLVSSVLGAAGSCLVSVPQEVIKQRLVTNVYPTFRSAVSTIYTTEGVSGFYSAWRPTVARNVPFVVFTFTSMDYLQRWLLDEKKKRKRSNNGDGGDDDSSISLTVAENLVIGISSSMIAASITHPADVIKTRMMTQASSAAVPYKSTVDCLQTIWKTEGWKSLYSGFPQRSVYMGPLWAIQFALNGKFHDAFRKQRVPPN